VMTKFLSLSNVSSGEVDQLLALARSLEKEPINDSLKGKVIGLLFMNPSLRTLASFQAGTAQLGGSAVVIQPGAGSWQLETSDGVVMDGAAVEHVREAIPVLASYCDLLGVRRFAEAKDLQTDLADEVMQKMSELCPKPFINMESASDHPCQALADWKTLDDYDIPRAGGKFVLSWAYHPKPLPYAVPLAAVTMALKRGMDVTVLRPDRYDLPVSLTGVKYTSDRDAAMDGAHVLYCKSWARPENYGGVEDREHLRDWCVRESWFAAARSDAKFMHCLPVRRNVKVADEVLDGPRSVVLRQAENRLHAQKALLMKMIGGAHG
jgi:N-acetylornithine carbamoyltransferase